MKNFKGIDGFSIKIIALIFMLFDHVRYAFLGVSGIDIPIWFSMIGRLSAPLFIFMTAKGMMYTKRPKKYMLRLYVASVIMQISNMLMNKFVQLTNGGILVNNIFQTLFLITFFIYCIRKIQEHRASGEKYFKYILYVLIPFVLSIIMLSLITIQIRFLNTLFLIFLPSPLFTEGGIIFILMGIAFYLCKESKKKLAIFYTIFCGIYLMITYNPQVGLDSIFLHDFQWLMYFSLPIMLCYNGKKGINMKWLFYVFYPLHLYILVIIANIIAN